MTRPRKVTIVEVGPRDGLQSEHRVLSVAERIALIEALVRSGLTVVEAGSFVSPIRVPQMAGTDAVLRGIGKSTNTRYPVLVPNTTGMRHAIDAGATEVAVFVAATESFSQRNISCSIDISLDRVAQIAGMSTRHGIRVRGYISCALGCPYEGSVSAAAVARLAARLVSLGCHEISLGDTIGVGTAQRAQDMVRTVAREVSVDRLAVHFHDTYGQALANVLACLEMGVSVIDAAAGGLGGCPFADGASGNLATEDLLYMLEGLGLETGVAMDPLLDAVDFIASKLGITVRSKVHAAMRGRSDAKCGRDAAG